jgi:phosphatidylglycerol:prolipoprotein diacylglycerol transferase
MWPVLFEINGYPVSTYGVMVSLAHLLGICAVLFLVRRRGHGLNPYVDLMFAVVFFGLLGARSAYVLEHKSEFNSALEWLQLWKGGLSLFGGLLAGFPAYLGFLLWRKLPVWETSDFLVPILPLCLALVRVGCFSAGCCHGTVTHLPWGVVPRSALIPFALAGETLHPTQLYEALYLLLLTLFLFWLSARRRPSGVVVCTFLLAYAAYRLATDHLRGDLEIVPALGAASSQAGALILLALSLAALIWRIRRKAT